MSHPTPPTPPLKNTNIYCFYSKLDEIGDERIKDNIELVELWRESWAAFGWNPVVLNLDDSLLHPQAEVILNQASPLFTLSRNSSPYLRLCYARWLAYSLPHVAFWADFDVINYGLDSDTLISYIPGLDEVAFLSLTGCAGYTGALGSSGNNQLNNQLIQKFREIAVQSKLGTSYVSQTLRDMDGEVSDMTISITINRSLYPISWGDVVYPIDYGRDECWKDSLLVHYDHSFTRIPRVGFIQEIRPLPFSFSQGSNRNMSMNVHANNADCFSTHEPSSSALRLAALAQLNTSASYLEIGVNQGTTFCDEAISGIPLRVAVDPQFNFDISQIANDRSVLTYEVTSDIFFSDICSRNQKFDLIFLDGLHTFAQTYRDFVNTLSHSTENTIWLIDNVFPGSAAQAEPDMARVKKLKQFLGEEHGWWMGDVFKIVPAIHEYHTCLSYSLIGGSDSIQSFRPGQLVVWHQPRNSSRIKGLSMAAIADMSYGDFLYYHDDFFSPTAWPDMLLQVKRSMGYS